MKELESVLYTLKRSPKSYPTDGTTSPTRPPLKIIAEESDKQIFGSCPVASDKTVCCNLRTIDAVENCAFACSYCTIQTFYGEQVVFHKNLKEKLQGIELEEDRFYHIGSGQSSGASVDSTLARS